MTLLLRKLGPSNFSGSHMFRHVNKCKVLALNLKVGINFTLLIFKVDEKLKEI